MCAGANLCQTGRVGDRASHDADIGADDESGLVALLRKGDAVAFRALVERNHASMLRVAGTFVSDRSTAEEVVQETWLAVIRGIAAFEGRSSVRSWIFAILVNRARSRGADKGRRPDQVQAIASDTDGPTVVSVDRFIGRPGRGRWRTPVAPWQDDPEIRQESAETRATILAAIDELPVLRREVLVLRDIEGWSAREVSDLLGITDTNQRVLLHRARNALRLRIEQEQLG